MKLSEYCDFRLKLLFFSLSIYRFSLKSRIGPTQNKKTKMIILGRRITCPIRISFILTRVEEIYANLKFSMQNIPFWNFQNRFSRQRRIGPTQNKIPN